MDLCLKTFRAVRSFVLLLIGALLIPGAFAEMAHVSVSDVSTRAASLSWVSDDSIHSISARVYADESGSLEITGQLDIVSVSGEVNGAHALGVAKLDIRGFAPSQCVFVKLVLEGATETVEYPLDTNLIEVCAADRASVFEQSGELIVNDSLLHQIFWPVGITPLQGSLLRLTIPSLPSAGLSLLVNSPNGTDTLLQVTNFLAESSDNTQLSDETIIQIEEFRGLGCPQEPFKRLVRYRKLPVQNELVQSGYRVLDAVDADMCTDVDTVCDRQIDIIDVQNALNILNATSDQCAFNPDIDIVSDGAVNVLDIQSILNFIGSAVP